MIERYLNKRYLTLYLFPFILGCLTVFSFQPFNYTFINFLILPLLFYLTVYIKKNQRVYRKKPYKKIFFLLVHFWIWIFPVRYLLDNKFINFWWQLYILIPIGLIVIPLFWVCFYSYFISWPVLNLNFISIFLFSKVLDYSTIFDLKFTSFPWNLWTCFPV